MTGAASGLPTIPTIPHISSLLLGLCLGGLLGALPGSEFCGAAGHLPLLAALHRKRVAFDFFRYDAAGADIGAVLDLHGSDEGAIRADENLGADVGEVLVETVVVAGDRAGADIGAGPHARVADIRQVVGFGAVLDHRLFHL